MFFPLSGLEDIRFDEVGNKGRTLLVGLSLSMCISAISRGKVDRWAVNGIVAGTSYEDEAAFDGVVDNYRKHYWRDRPDLAEAIARWFKDNGRIHQPRLYGAGYPSVVGGRIWMLIEVDRYGCVTAARQVSTRDLPDSFRSNLNQLSSFTK